MKLICNWEIFFSLTSWPLTKSELVLCGPKKKMLHLLVNPKRRTGLCSRVPFLIGKKITRVLRMRKSWRRLAFGVALIDVGFRVRHSVSFSRKWWSSEALREFFLELILKMPLESDTGQIKASASVCAPLSQSYACPDHLDKLVRERFIHLGSKMELIIKNQ